MKWSVEIVEMLSLANLANEVSETIHQVLVSLREIHDSETVRYDYDEFQFGFFSTYLSA